MQCRLAGRGEEGERVTLLLLERGGHREDALDEAAAPLAVGAESVYAKSGQSHPAGWRFRLQLRPAAARRAPDRHHTDDSPGLVHAEVDVMPGVGHESAADPRTSGGRPADANARHLAYQLKRRFEFFREEPWCRAAVVLPPQLDTGDLLLRALGDLKLHVALAARR